MKRIKVIATLFIVFSASLMNFHDHTLSSVNFFSGSEMGICTDLKVVSENPGQINPECQTKEMKPFTVSDAANSDVDQKMSSGKNYEATMVIM
jgi:hypothetical protein